MFQYGYQHDCFLGKEAFYCCEPEGWRLCVFDADGSKLPEEQKLELQKTLSQVASSNGQQSVANKLVKEPQSMTDVPAYLTQADWDVLLQGDLDKAPHVLVARLRLCGITSLKEDSKKVCIALLVQSLLWHGHKMPDPQTIYKMAQQFTFLFNGRKWLVSTLLLGQSLVLLRARCLWSRPTMLATGWVQFFRSHSGSFFGAG